MLPIAPDQTEAILLRAMQKRERIKFSLKGVDINPVKSLKYLVIINETTTFCKHRDTKKWHLEKFLISID